MKKLIKLTIVVVSIAMLPITVIHAGSGSNNHAAVFAGATTKKTTDPTVAVEYEYRTPFWSNKIGVGLVGEQIYASKKTSTLLLAGAVLHPWKDLKVNLFTGAKFVGGKTKTVFRAGLGYDFHYNSISFGPVYNIDSIKGDLYHVYGVTIGVGF